MTDETTAEEVRTGPTETVEVDPGQKAPEGPVIASAALEGELADLIADFQTGVRPGKREDVSELFAVILISDGQNLQVQTTANLPIEGMTYLLKEALRQGRMAALSHEMAQLQAMGVA